MCGRKRRAIRWHTNIHLCRRSWHRFEMEIVTECRLRTQNTTHVTISTTAMHPPTILQHSSRLSAYPAVISTFQGSFPASRFASLPLQNIEGVLGWGANKMTVPVSTSPLVSARRSRLGSHPSRLAPPPSMASPCIFFIPPPNEKRTTKKGITEICIKMAQAKAGIWS